MKTQSAVAYACALADGMIAKMSFNYPTAIVRLLDIGNLEDVVEDGADIAKPVTREYIINGKTTIY